MLLKNDKDRPTTRNILDLPLIEKYMKDFLQKREKVVQGMDGEATARIQRKAELKEQATLTPKEKLQKKKQEEAEKKFKELSLAAKGAGQRLVEYLVDLNGIGQNKENSKNYIMKEQIQVSIPWRSISHHLILLLF